MLDPQSIANIATKELRNVEPNIEEAIKKAANVGKSSVLFEWKFDDMEAHFVDKYRENKEIFPEGFDIGSDSEGMTVSWEKLM